MSLNTGVTDSAPQHGLSERMIFALMGKRKNPEMEMAYGEYLND
jgi:hypothetical protein